MRNRIDAILNRWVSRKLMVFVISTLLALFGDLTSSDWTILATAYIGGQTFVDVVDRLKNQQQ